MFEETSVTIVVYIYCMFQMVARPAFTVEINKGSSKTLAIHCQFPSQAMMDQQEQDQYGMSLAGERYVVRYATLNPFLLN